MKKIVVMLFGLLGFAPHIRSEHFAIWHWHLNYNFDADSLKTLAEIPIQELYFQAGNFAFIRNEAVFESITKRQNFLADFSGLQFAAIHLCYTFGNSPISPFVGEFLNKNSPTAIAYLVEQIKHDFLFYSALNKRVQGIQIDLEGSGIDFTVYLNLLTALKKALPQVVLSITPMSSWIKRPDFQKIVPAVDFIVPMLYDFHRGRRVDDTLKVTDYYWLQKMVAEWEQLGVPIVYGLPTYSYAILYDQNGQMSIPWAVYGPDAVTENRRFDLRHFDFNRSNLDELSFLGKDRVISYVAQERFSFSQQNFAAGAVFKYNFISAQALHDYINAIKSVPAKHRAGIAFFRYGKPTEGLVLSARRLKSAVQGNFQAPLNIQVDKINTANHDFFISFSNNGAPTYFGKTGFRVQVEQKYMKGHSADFDRISCQEHCVWEEDYFDQGEMLISPLLDQSCLEMQLTFILKNGATAERTIITTAEFPFVLK